MNEAITEELRNSNLALGNIALRKKEYTTAITHYKLALTESPSLSRSILGNLKIATSRLTGEASRDSHDDLCAMERKVHARNFDSAYYLANNPDVKHAGLDAEDHYYLFGEGEGRMPNAFFDPSFYIRINADVRAAAISPFAHFRDHGLDEGRYGKANEISRKTSTNIKPLLFVGHDGIQAGSETVLLEVIRWFHKHTTRKIKLLLLSPGPMASTFTDYAETYVLPSHVDDEENLLDFLNENFELAYLNTVVSGRFLSMLADYGKALDCDIVTHIHEMQNVIDAFPKEMKILLSRTTLWISASPRSTKMLVAKYGISEKKVITVPAFINPTKPHGYHAPDRQVARDALGISSGALVVVGCGTVYHRKGVDLFIETARQVKESSAEAVQFVWIGDGPDLASMRATLTPDECKYIFLVGNRINANHLIACGDLFFMSSREDPFPLVVLEAAQHRIPSICFRPATGIVDFIEKDAGFVLDKICTKSAARLIIKLSSQPETIRDRGEKAYEKVYAAYTSEIQAVKIFRAIASNISYTPAVSVIVPFYNHKAFIQERMKSILEQSIKDIEIIVLDDASTDGTRAQLSKYSKKGEFKLSLNKTNSGSPFSQWANGVSLANADIVWIAEGDDSCDPDFLKILLPAFSDPMVTISAAKTVMMDERGVQAPTALDDYMNGAYEGKFQRSYKTDGFTEVNQQLGAVCTLVNASGLLVRKNSFGNSLAQAQKFKMAGDWFIYLECLKHGKLNYDVRTTNFFRRHSQSQIHKLEGSAQYFQERELITKHVVENYHVNDRFLKKAFSVVEGEWERFSHKHPGLMLSDVYSEESIISLAHKRVSQRHVALYVHGMTFSKGGIERAAALLSNHLLSIGWKVTILCSTSKHTLPVYPLFEGVAVLPIFDETDLSSSVAKMRRKLLNLEVDVFVPMLSEWLFAPVMEAAAHTGIPVIVSEHNDPWRIQDLWWTREERHQCFSKADAIHLLLDKYRDSLPATFQQKTHVIPNGVTPNHHLNNDRQKIILSVGRLEPQKRFDRLITAVAMNQQTIRAAGFKVEIYGEGRLLPDLKEQICENGIEDIFKLKGRTENIEEIYRSAYCFVLASDFEGLPVTLLEAFSFGLPAIAFKSCNGPNEVIIDRINGRLADSIEEFSEAIVELFNPQTYQSYAEAAKCRAGDFSLTGSHQEWERLLVSTIQNSLINKTR
ncbi:glycosyltransferase [Pseudomonas lutea]|jgi:glycosyltransferase involved in cell wall biosynthesis|uniref:Glycosyltransferase n=1 Tax=Pseudomonas lutea TaxID=243924 RepID=A0ABR9AF33_9PSED|nr:glycosyltransferase [Pseudomonas lutea]MBD8124352.1 glycosyltransferase [Pseudomonas lutea]